MFRDVPCSGFYRRPFFAVNKFFGGNFFIGCCRLDHRFVASENILCILCLGVVVLVSTD